MFVGFYENETMAEKKGDFDENSNGSAFGRWLIRINALWLITENNFFGFNSFNFQQRWDIEANPHE